MDVTTLSGDGSVGSALVFNTIGVGSNPGFGEGCISRTKTLLDVRTTPRERICTIKIPRLHQKSEAFGNGTFSKNA